MVAAPTGEQKLNFARKYRPTTLDAIVGQDVPLRMLKNSLYRNVLFPVYLFSGQRGCGKTTTARVFARAINCEQLEAFRSSPTTQQLPCMQCASCRAISQGNHPDFFEIDGASHTGVDNVRLLVETAHYLPSLGKKKVYLIDEAHMLSKAAFNAFLKILEEPPLNALFMLATTEREKIPATVLSRCFQAQFPALSSDALKKILTHVCEQEKIIIEENAIKLIIHESEGAARDALNLLERVHLHQNPVTEQSVIDLLGGISPVLMTRIISALLTRDQHQIVIILSECLTSAQNATRLWGEIVNGLQAVLRMKLSIVGADKNSLLGELPLSACSKEFIYASLRLMFHYEAQFCQTSKKELLLELVLLLMCEAHVEVPAQKKPFGLEQKQSSGSLLETKHVIIKNEQNQATTIPPIVEKNNQIEQQTTQAPPKETPGVPLNWQRFVASLGSVDMLLHAIFSSATFIGYDEQSKQCSITLRTATTFITEAIDEKKNLWLALLQKEFINCTGFLFVPSEQQPKLTPSHNDYAKKSTVAQSGIIEHQPKIQKEPPTEGYKKKASLSPKTELVVLNPEQFPIEKWPKLHLILSHFPGTLKKNIDK